MRFRRSRAIVPVLEVFAEAASTNDVLRARARDLPDLAVVVTENQTGGRGRLDRVWVCPPGKGLAISVLLRPHGLGAGAFGWFPLLAGVAMSRALSYFTTREVAVKWPNDVLIDEAKVCGILSELLPGVDGAIVGAGVNLTLEQDELPTPTSTSLTCAGADEVDPDTVLAAYLTQLSGLYQNFVATDGDPIRSALRDEVTEMCHTLGRSVRVELPSGDVLLGTATGIDENGRLIVESDDASTAVAAGDVTHLRY